MDEVRRDGEQHATLAARLEHQPQPTGLEVAQAAVDQARRHRGSAAAEVAFVHQRRAKAAQRRIARHRGTGDATAHDEQVQWLRAHRVQRGGAGRGRERRIGQCPPSDFVSP